LPVVAASSRGPADRAPTWGAHLETLAQARADVEPLTGDVASPSAPSVRATWDDRFAHAREAAAHLGSAAVNVACLPLMPAAAFGVSAITGACVGGALFGISLLTLNPVLPLIAAPCAGAIGTALTLFGTVKGSIDTVRSLVDATVRDAQASAWSMGAALAGTPYRGHGADHEAFSLDRVGALAVDARDATNSENVMNSGRIHATETALERLRCRFPTVDENAQLDGIAAFLDELARADLPPAVHGAVFRRRGGATELENARRVLAHLRQERPALSSMPMPTLAAIAWHAIDAYRGEPNATRDDVARDQANMRASLFAGLSQCVESNGHIVCSVGISQRLVSALQGAYDEAAIDVSSVNAVVTGMCRELTREVGEGTPTRAGLAELAGAVVTRAHELFGSESAAARDVIGQVAAYLDMTWPLDELAGA
jgi:hypothetical protein